MFDVIIRGGTVIDGTGRDRYTADVAVKGKHIAKIGDLRNEKAKTEIDGRGLIVSPGFIDVHSHGDGTILLYPNAESALRQGVTTFVGGQCGDSPAPRSDSYYMRHFWEYDAWYEVDGHTFYADFVQPKEKALAAIEKHFGVRLEFSTFGDWLDRIEEKGISPNFIPLLGHGTIRAHSMGPKGADRAPTEEEMCKMKDYLKEAMESGAWGFSTGLDYPPSAYAKTEEIKELVRELKPYDGFYNTHWRRTGIRRGIPGQHFKIDGITEACEIAEETGVKTQISHISPGFDIKPMPTRELDAASARETLKIIDGYIKRGAKIAFDVITSTSAGFECVPYLIMYFAPWVRMSGGARRFAENLRSFDFREDFKAQIEAGKWFKVSPKVNPEWDKTLYITKTSAERAIGTELAGKSLRSITDERKAKDSIDTVIDLLIEDPLTMVRENKHNEGSIQEFINHERAMPCIDSYVYDDAGPFGIGMEIPEILPHYNAYCGMIKYITEYGQPRLEDTIRKMTGVPAGWLGMKRRGKLEEGCFADIVVFSEKNLKTNENPIEPRQRPEGIECVLVNGKVTVRQGEHTGERAGEVLRYNKKELFR